MGGQDEEILVQLERRASKNDARVTLVEDIGLQGTWLGMDPTWIRGRSVFLKRILDRYYGPCSITMFNYQRVIRKVARPRSLYSFW